jgi:flagellar basal-body rod modification protein FlgD
MSAASPVGSLLPASAASLNGTSSAATTAASNSQQPNFMQLLMAQMQNQDPSSPTNATDYITQMAQMSSVQGINQLNQNITSLLAMQSVTQGVGLIGKTVTYTNAAGKQLSGVVSAVSLVGGQPQLVINNANVAVSQIQTIQATSKSGAAPAATAAGA